MAGYSHDFSKSNNALAAEAAGCHPATEVARLLRVPVEVVRRHGAREWHHTSKWYNKTDYYDVDDVAEWLGEEEGKEALAQVLAERSARRAAVPVVHRNCTVVWLEWGGTRNHPRAMERRAEGCIVEEKAGAKFVAVTLPDGKTFRKGRGTRGFEVRSAEGKLLV